MKKIIFLGIVLFSFSCSQEEALTEAELNSIRLRELLERISPDNTALKSNVYVWDITYNSGNGSYSFWKLVEEDESISIESSVVRVGPKNNYYNLENLFRYEYDFDILHLYFK